jgi:hypothetical protein
MAGADPASGGPGADPVRELMAAHRELCERATHPLEIAAGLEQLGVGAALAGRYRHAQVFSLAEELFARVPRRPDLPQAGGAAAAVDKSIQRPREPRLGLVSAAALSGVLLLPLVTALGGGSGSDGIGTAVALVLAAWVATGAAGWTARWVRHVGQAQLRTATTLAQFRARMRPVLPVALGLHQAALALTGFGALAVLTALAPHPGPAASGGLLHAVVQRAGPTQWVAQAVLGLLIAAAAVLRRCGRGTAAAAGLLTADGLGAGLSALRFGGLLPSAGWAAVPGALTALATGTAAAVLLPYAWLLLGRPQAHR